MSRDFLFSISKPSNLHAEGPLSTTFSCWKAQPATRQPEAHVGMQPTGRLTRFPAIRWTPRHPFACFPSLFPAACGLYPAGNGNAAILPSMAPNSRRVRWLSASSSQ